MDLRGYHLFTGIGRIVGGILCLLVVIPVVFFFGSIFRLIILAALLPVGSGLIATGVRQLKLLKKDAPDLHDV